MFPRITLKPGKDKPVRHRHPWVFSGAIGRIEGSAPGTTPAAGDIVRVVDATGEFLAWGYFSPRSQIAVRLLEWNEDIEIDTAWWHRKLVAAVAARQNLFHDENTTAFRLVHAEADGLPGLIVDRYCDIVVIQSLTAGIDAVKSIVLDALDDLVHPAVICERSEGSPRTLEGLPEVNAVLTGEASKGPCEIREHGHRFLVDCRAGQKTGFYLDQRDNRARVAAWARDRDVLDCFCYTGAFTVYACANGARGVTCVDSSGPALSLLRQNVALDAGGAVSVAQDIIEANVKTIRKQNNLFSLFMSDIISTFLS